MFILLLIVFTYFSNFLHQLTLSFIYAPRFCPITVCLRLNNQELIWKCCNRLLRLLLLFLQMLRPKTLRVVKTQFSICYWTIFLSLLKICRANQLIIQMNCPQLSFHMSNVCFSSFISCANLIRVIFPRPRVTFWRISKYVFSILLEVHFMV